jgi:hypothetical protein
MACAGRQVVLLAARALGAIKYGQALLAGRSGRRQLAADIVMRGRFALGLAGRLTPEWCSGRPVARRCASGGISKRQSRPFRNRPELTCVLVLGFAMRDQQRQKTTQGSAPAANYRGERVTVSGEKARGGEIILRPIERWIFIAGLVAAVIVAILVAVVVR